MRRPVIRFLTVSFIILFLLFFSFVHSLFRLQLFKYAVSQELEEKLQVATLKMEEQYESIQNEAEVSRERVLEGNRRRSQLVVEQVYGLIVSIEKNKGLADTQKEISELKATLSEYNNSTDRCFWILDSQSRVILSPLAGQTDVDLGDGQILADWINKRADGPVSLKGSERNADNPGYGKHLSAQGWTLVSFQQWDITKKKINGIESLRKARTDNLIRQMGAEGSAGVVDEALRFKEYTHVQFKNHPVDDLRLESLLPPSKLLFNKSDGIRDYVLIVPVSNRGEFRHAYVHYDEKTGYHYFIAQNVRTLFKGIDRRSSPMLVYLGAWTLVLLLFNVSILLRELFVRMKSREDV